MGRLTLAHFGRTRPALDALSRQGQALSTALVRRATLSEALRAAPEWALPIASVVCLFALNTGTAAPAPATAPLLLLLGMAGAILAGLSRSIDLHLAKTLALTRLSTILEAQGVDQAAAATTPAVKRGQPVDMAISLTDAAGNVRSFEIGAGAVVSFVGRQQEQRSSILAAVARLRDDPAVATAIGGVPSARIAIRDWRRMVTLSSPRLPLIRGTIRKNLMIGAPSDTAEDDVLGLAGRFGIAGEPGELDVSIEPNLLPVTGAMALRLCRSLLRRAPVILLDESISAADFPLIEEFLRLARERRITIVTSGCVMGDDGKPIGEPIALTA